MNNEADYGAAASSLMDLFQPPPPPPHAAQDEPSDHDDDNYGSDHVIVVGSPPLVRDSIFEKLFNVPGHDSWSAATTTPVKATRCRINSVEIVNRQEDWASEAQQADEHTPLMSSLSSGPANEAGTPRIGTQFRKVMTAAASVPASSSADRGAGGATTDDASTSFDFSAGYVGEVNTPTYHNKSFSSLPPIFETSDSSAAAAGLEPSAGFQTRRPHANNTATPMTSKINVKLTAFLHDCCKSGTWIGAVMYMLYHVVFCLTMGSAITRPHGSSGTIMLGLFTKMAALGVMFGAPVYWIGLSNEIPAIYPTADLFSAPFLANIAMIVDEVLNQDSSSISEQNNDQVFLATFSFLTCMAILISATLLYMSTIFKLANLGSYLPFPVLCGFFAAVGVLMWTLAVKVDTGGIGIGHILFSGDTNLMLNTLVHHLPSVIIAILMKLLGPRNPFYVIGLVFASIGLFYTTLLISGYSKEQATKDGWLWSTDALEYKPIDAPIGWSTWAPPAPFGWINFLILGKVHWGAVSKGMETTLALSFLYMIRCSLHGAAVRKNVSNLKRTVTGPEEVPSSPSTSTSDLMAGLADNNHRRRLSEWTTHRRRFSEVVDMDWGAIRMLSALGGGESEDDTTAVDHVETVKTHVVYAKPTHYTLKHILSNYAYSQFCCGLVGSFAVVPSVAASSTMYSLAADHVAPQVFACIFVVIFYLTDFTLVSYIPKPAFSSLLVLAVIDMIDVWFIKAYYKTREKEEWLVVPAIVILAFVVGLLGAVFLGIAMSTFLFVASFFRTGVVKYIANGITIRSTIERSPSTASWLDENGDLIQVLVLQNYLFFGNASSTMDYIGSMFEQLNEDDTVPYGGLLPPIPKIIILDLTLVTGMDTSAVDVFSGIMNLCKKEDCRLFISGVAVNVRQVMELSGFKPETTTKVRSKRKLRFFSDLDTAVGKAEDLLLNLNSVEDNQIRRPADSGGGFNNALIQITEQLQVNCYNDLIGLKEYTKEIHMESGQVLYKDVEAERGLFFIESGIMKLERDTEATLTRSATINALTGLLGQHNGSLNSKRARSSTIARELARLKAGGGAVQARNRPTFRIARVGPGWVLGADEVLTGEIAAEASKVIAVSPCRLHYIPFATIDRLEETEPLLVLKLHKLLSFLMAKRQTVTINQLATLHSIMSASAHKKPIRRSYS